MTRLLLCLAPILMVAACGPIDTSALEQVEEAAANARQATERLNAGAALAEKAAQDPVNTLRDATLSARFTRVATAEPNLFVLTDVTTGCQYLATYAADGSTVQSIAPRTGDGGAQRCIASTVADESRAPEAESLIGKVIGAAG